MVNHTSSLAYLNEHREKSHNIVCAKSFQSIGGIRNTIDSPGERKMVKNLYETPPLGHGCERFGLFFLRIIFPIISSNVVGLVRKHSHIYFVLIILSQYIWAVRWFPLVNGMRLEKEVYRSTTTWERCPLSRSIAYVWKPRERRQLSKWANEWEIIAT